MVKIKKYLIIAIIVFIAALSTIFVINNLNQNNSDSASEIKVSVIIPVYKTEMYIRECMDSVINQTLKDIEIICVDDGSPDDSGKILDEYAKNDNRVHVIHQKNAGVSVARNNGISEAKGEYIKFVDSDDFIDKETCQICYNKSKEFDADIVFHDIEGDDHAGEQQDSSHNSSQCRNLLAVATTTPIILLVLGTIWIEFLLFIINLVRRRNCSFTTRNNNIIFYISN